MRYRVTLCRNAEPVSGDPLAGVTSISVVVEASNQKEAMFAADEKLFETMGLEWMPQYAEPAE